MSYPYPYLPPETEVVFMDNDPDLRPITVKLPEPPPMEEMLYYGLPPEEQYWKRFQVPAKLQALQRDQTIHYREKVKILEANQAYYANEIEWIKKDIEYSRKGLWVMLNGRGYYFPRFYYNYLQWWPIDSKFPKQRNRDRKYFIFGEFTDNDSDCLGFNYPKHRREGATNKEKCRELYEAMETPDAHFGTQSKDETHARAIHEKFTDFHWRYTVPFWRKPIYNENNNDITQLSFTTPIARSKPTFGEVALNTKVDYRDSGEKGYDGLKLRKIYNDEIGKTEEVDVKRRFDIQRPCLIDGSSIIGKMRNTSTVDEMDKKGGKNFKKICDLSHYHQRNEKTGRTTTWLFNLFMPASEGFGGEMPKYFQEKYGCKEWVDKFGFDIINPETGRPAAEEYHEAEAAEKKRSGDMDGFIEYRRQNPLRWRDCWLSAATENNFNIQILEDRIEEFRYGPPPNVQRGFFRWKDNIPDTFVEWIIDPNGKFEISFQFDDPEKDSNRFYIMDGIKKPANANRFTAGGDAFKFKRTKLGKKSKGGGAVFWMHDIVVDPPWKDMHNWNSCRFICTYLHRPTDKKIYAEDMLMMCIYWGCEMFPEINVELLWDHFTDRGYPGYLAYAYDPKRDQLSVTPGAQTGTKIIEDIFRETQFHIQNHGHRECHEELLKQWIEIEDDMGDYDLFTAAGYALLRAKKTPLTQESEEKTDIDNYFDTYLYNLDENSNSNDYAI